MHKVTLLLLFLCPHMIWGQSYDVIEHKVTKFSIEQLNDTIEFIVVDTALTESKPVFLWCQGSLPVPLFCEVAPYGNYFFGGGVSNFDYNKIAKSYHLVIISMPKTPLMANKEHLNKQYQYIPDPKFQYEFSSDYIKADYLENYVNRANAVLDYLNDKKWVDHRKLVVAGHSQGTKVATKIAVNRKDVTHLGLFSANPFGRIDQYIREARLDAELGKISWQKADSIMNENYEFMRMVCNADSIKTNPGLLAWNTFSETYYDDWLQLNIPICLTYGTKDRTADLCDIVPLFFIEKNKNNLTLKRYLGLEHNFFEVLENGQTNYEKGHWMEVMNDFLAWIK